MEHDSKKKMAWSVLVNKVRRIWTIPLRWKDTFRLRHDRLLAQGGIRTLGIVIIYGLFVTLLVVFGLFFYYGEYFFPNWICTPDYAQGSFKPKNIFDAAYYLLFTNGGQNLFEGSHIWGAVITSVGIILIAFLTSSLTSLMERRAERYLTGESWYRMKKHIVVFGASDYLYSIIREKTRETGVGCVRHQRFLIVTTKDVKAVRREVFSFLENGAHKKDFVFLFGERTSEEDISHLSLEYAREVFIIGDSEESDDYESYRDANNMDCVKAIGNYLDRVAYSDVKIVKDGVISPKTPKALLCHVMFEYQTSFAAFQFSKPELSARLDFRPFNYYDLWAQKMLVTKGEGVYKHKYLDTIFEEEEENKKKNRVYIGKDSEQTVHLIILGMTKMGIAMGIQAAHVCHYPNFLSSGDDKTKLKRTRITFIDANADIEMNYLKGRFPCMMSETRVRYMDYSKKTISSGGWKGDEKGWYDIEWEFIKGRIESPVVQDYIEKAAGDKSRIVTIAICLPKSHQSMATAMYMRESVYANVLQIFAYQRYSGTIVKELKGRYQKIIVPFGMMESGYDSSLDDDTRAMLVSYVYASYYAFNPSTKKKEAQTDTDFTRFENFIDSPLDSGKYRVYPDYSYKWPEEKLFEKLSSAYNASTISTKLRGIGILNEDDCKSLTDGQVDILKTVEHNRWNLEKMLTGYRALNEEEAALMEGLWNDANNKSLNQDKIDQRKAEWEMLTKKTWEEMYPEEDFTVSALWEKQRGILKGWPLRAHLDICSSEELARRETEDTINMDKNLSKAIPSILRVEKELKEKHRKNKHYGKQNIHPASSQS